MRVGACHQQSPRSALSPLLMPFINLSQYHVMVLSDSSIRNSVRFEIYGVMCDKAASSAKSHLVLLFFLSFSISVELENWVLPGSSNWFVRLEKAPAFLHWTEGKEAGCREGVSVGNEGPRKTQSSLRMVFKSNLER